MGNEKRQQTNEAAHRVAVGRLRALGYQVSDEWPPQRRLLEVMTTAGQNFSVKVHGLSAPTAFWVGNKKPADPMLYYVLVYVPDERCFVLTQKEADRLCDQYRGFFWAKAHYAEEGWDILPSPEPSASSPTDRKITPVANPRSLEPPPISP